MWNGNVGTGQGQNIVNIQENYSLLVNTLSATSNPAHGCTLGVLGVGCRSVSQANAPFTNPFVPVGPIGLNGGFNTSTCRVLSPRSNRFRCSALTNANVETVPTSSGSNTLALDEQNYVAFLPVNGVQNSGLPAGDFTGNGARLCGNTTTRNGLTTGPGCIIVFKQQYLSPLGGGPVMGN